VRNSPEPPGLKPSYNVAPTHVMPIIRPAGNGRELVRWFKRADKQPFFFAGICRPWTGDRGTKRVPNIGNHTLFSIMITEPNAVVKPIHEKAMPVMLMTPDDAIAIRPEEKKVA